MGQTESAQNRRILRQKRIERRRIAARRKAEAFALFLDGFLLRRPEREDEIEDGKDSEDDLCEGPKFHLDPECLEYGRDAFQHE